MDTSDPIDKNPAKIHKINNSKNKNHTCGLIVLNGEIKDYSFYGKYFEKASLIISVDGAASHMLKFDVLPDVMIGDFDSITKKEYDYFSNQNIRIITFPAEKDKTDAELAIEYALDMGVNEFIILGAIGSRMDHTLSNIFLLNKITENGACGWIVNENNKLTLINSKKNTITLIKEGNEKVSLLPLSEEVEGITTNGLYYPLVNEKLIMGSSRGVSNEFTGSTAKIKIEKGLLLVLKSKD